jgi:hypothetical protein
VEGLCLADERRSVPVSSLPCLDQQHPGAVLGRGRLPGLGGTADRGAPGWWFAVLAVPLWLWLVYRAWTLSAALDPDALIVRGLLSTRRIPLAGITAAGISSSWRGTWAPLIVTAQRRRHVIWAVERNEYARPGRRLEADEAVDAIRAAAALPRS